MSTSNPPSDAARVRFPPPLVFALAILGGGLLQSWLPIASPVERGPITVAGATALVLFGVALLAASMVHFARTQQNPEPWKPSPELIAEGIYRWTRNPMYLGMASIQAGIGVAVTNAWVLLLVPVACLAVVRIAIRPEERYLEEKFGDSYRAYRRSVHRWLGRRAAS